MWWAFNRYEILDGAVRRQVGGRLEAFDPWEKYRASREERSSIPPYAKFVNLIDRIPPDQEAWPRLDQENRQALTEWCKDWGLLGILPHRALSITWPFGYTTESNDKAVWVWEGFYRTARGWEPIGGFEESGTSRAPREPERWPVSGVAYRERGPAGHDALRILKPEDVLPPFFPGLSKSQLESGLNRPPILPLSKGFWQWYAEPVDEFVAEGRIFAGALRDLTVLWGRTGKRRRRQNMTTEQRSQLDSALARLNQLAGEQMSNMLESRPDGSFERKTVYPSLLSAFAMMATEDLLAKRILLYCQKCGNLFSSLDPKSLYCEDKCRWATQKKKRRERERKADGGGGKRRRRATKAS
jgi:hypothetical protein